MASSDDETASTVTSTNDEIEIESISTESQIWTEKYRPKTLDEYYMSHRQLSTVKKWIKDYMTADEDAKPFLILYGTAGIGKTTLAHLIFKKYKFEVIECNASDSRSKKNLQDQIGQIGKLSVLVTEKAAEHCDFFGEDFKPFDDDDDALSASKKKISITRKKPPPIPIIKRKSPKREELTAKSFKQTAIIMDEIDGLTGGESGGVQELLDIILKQDPKTKAYKSICPVICTTNSIREKKLQTLVKLGVVVNVSKPSGSDARKLVERITTTENFTLPETTITKIINDANGDYRQIIALTHEAYLNQKFASYNITTAITQSNSHSNQSQLTDLTVSNYEDSEDYSNAIRLLSNIGDTPLEKINHFLSNDTHLDDIRYICSGDSNLFYLNLYFNILPIMSAIQNKKGETKTKEQLQNHMKQLCHIYESLTTADAMNDTIFNNKNWELIHLFEYMGLAIPIKEMSLHNIKQKLPSGSYITHVQNFHLQHHTQYNYMRQEQTANEKMLLTDSLKTFEQDPINIYYKLKTFEIENKEKMTRPTSQKAATRKNMSQNPHNIDKSYQKIIEKIETLIK